MIKNQLISTMDTIRTFIAIDINVEKPLQDKWQEIKDLLQSEQIKWVDGDKLHLTLFFLGDTPIKNIDGIANRLEKELYGKKEFKIAIQGFGYFGSASNPKVFWTGVSKSDELILVKDSVTKALNAYGFIEEHREFSAHITLARIKFMKQPKLLTNFIQQNKSIIFQESVVDRIILYNSDLRPSGPIYTPIKEIKLLSL